jgi:hydrophobic/amphiphilic exporter-1 (mainly G- bacteria), HAE1 family
MKGPRSSGAHFTTDRPVAVLMVFAAAVVFGFFSFQRLPVSLMPHLSYPTITVRTEYPGAAPEEVENEVSRPIEEALGVISGLNRISSVSRAGISDVVLEFVWGTQMSDATQNTLEKLDLVFLPAEAERPLILHFDPSLDPIMELSFSGSGTRFEGESGLRRLRRIAELQVKRALEPIPGVAAVRVRGGLEEEIHILLNEEKLLRSGLSIQAVIDRLRQENINVAGGNILEGRSEYMVRTLNEYENLEQIADTVVQRFQEREVRVKDLGRVVRAHKDREIITKMDGAESVQIDIYKEADANMVAVAKRVTTAIGQLPELKKGDGAGRGGRPAGLAAHLWDQEEAKLQVVADRSHFIENSINQVRNTALIGGALAVAVLFLFLASVKTTLIVAVSIPMSLLITFAPLNLLGVSLNIMSLGGLALGIGMLVDSSIVVLESIFRCREEGDDTRTAAVRGVSEVRGAVTASTLTSIAVFFPMVFVQGIAGQAFGHLGLAVVISLLAALGVALFFIPMLASRERVRWNDTAMEKNEWFRFSSGEIFREACAGTPRPQFYFFVPYFTFRFALHFVFELAGKLVLLIFAGLGFLIARIFAPGLAAAGGAALNGPVRWMGRFMRWQQEVYRRTLQRALDHPGPVFLAVAICLMLTWQAAIRLDSELLPEVHQGEFTFEVNLPVGTPIEETEEILRRVETALLENKQEIRSVLATFGFDVGNMRRSDEGEHSARFKILLKPNRHQRVAEERVLRRLRGYFADLPDVDVRVVRPILFSFKAPIVVEIHGDNLPALKERAHRAQEILAALPELADVETSLKSGSPEIQINYDREKLARYGLNINQVAKQVRDMVKGYEATRFNMKDRRIPMVVRLEERHREQTEDVGRLIINAGGQQPIPLYAIADLRMGEGPSEVRRVDGRRVALVQANIATGSLGGAVKAIESNLRKGMDWPADMNFYITGQNEEWERSKGSLYLALGLSLFLVYVIMAAQFESLLQPLIILLTVPLAFVGAILGLKALDISLSIVVFLGFIMLVGIVVNNAIVLIDYINTLKQRGAGRREAIVAACSVRLRPILMTTATTVLGLTPMAIGWGDGAEIRMPMAVAVMGGLVTSTLLTLLVVPTVYSLVDELKGKWIKPPSGDDDAVEEGREIELKPEFPSRV